MMKYVPKSAAKKFQNSATTEVLEYPLDDKDIDAAIVNMNGGYPDKGFAVNKECKEILYVVSGRCTLSTKNESVNLGAGDEVLIEKGELFRYDDAKDLVLVAICNPAWTAGQHKVVGK